VGEPPTPGGRYGNPNIGRGASHAANHRGYHHPLHPRTIVAPRACEGPSPWNNSRTTAPRPLLVFDEAASHPVELPFRRPVTGSESGPRSRHRMIPPPTILLNGNVTPPADRGATPAGRVASPPPLTEETSPLAALRNPPLTDELSPLAVLLNPPLTEANSPLAALNRPPLTAALVPLASLLPPADHSVSPAGRVAPPAD
jgi:hypothetical protein